MIPTQDQSPLSPRQTEILQMLADGKTRPEIAAALGIREQTIKNHIYGNGGVTSGIAERTKQPTLVAAVAESMRRMWIV